MIKILIKKLVTSIGYENYSIRYLRVKKSLLDITDGFTILDAGASQQRYITNCSH
jgi:hypothetical protein